MQLNGIDLVDRHNRPNLSSRTGLRVFFYNDGVPVDPYAFSGVTVFEKNANITPNSIIDSNNVVASGLTTDTIKAHFGTTPNVNNLSNSALPEASYGVGASGIFKVATGEYVVVLDGQNRPVGGYDYHGASFDVTSTTSIATDYIDVWLVKLLADSDYQVLISGFTLFNDTFYTTTEPILLTPHPKLHNRRITLGSKVDLKITNDITVENSGLTEEIKNIFKHNVITNPQIKIEKLNEEQGFPSRVDVLGYADTSALIDVTSDNTLVLNWDPETSKSLTSWTNGTFGTLTGPYQITVKYTMLNQTYVSPPFTVIVS
tara:strand:- start:244 stop:1191 length:948 start_codon:yes stop_codon:yes gene_type:complete